MITKPYGDAFPGESVAAPAMTAPAIRDVQVPCPSCGSAGGWIGASPAMGAAPFVYSYGRVEPRIPSVGVEKELVQFATRVKRTSLDDLAFLRAVLADKGSRYLARHYAGCSSATTGICSWRSRATATSSTR